MTFRKTLTGSVVAITICVTSCVTTHSGVQELSSGSKLAVSCSRVKEYDAGNVYALLCTIENKTKDWMTFHVKEIAPLESGAPDILSPVQVDKYISAIQFRNAKNDYNTSLALTGIFLGGLVASSSGSPTLASVGTASAVGSGVLLASREVEGSRKNATSGGYKYGEQHLLGDAEEIPGELFVRKVLLIESNSGLPERINLCLDMPKAECMTVGILGVSVDHKADCSKSDNPGNCF